MNKEIINTVIRNRKSIYPKDYSGEEVPDIVIKEILLNANHAPTHRLTQPWFFKVYKNESKQNLIEIVSKIDESKLSKIKLNKFIQKVNDSNVIISIFLNRDLKERLPKIFNDMKIKGKQDKIDLFLKWINQRVLPIIQSSEESGAIGIYVLSKKK